MIRLQALGGLDLDVGNAGRFAPSLRPRVLALLALLLGAGTRAISRDKVLAYLWPNSDSDHARNSLKQALFTIRHHLGPSIVQSCCGGLRLDRSLVACDVWEFEQAICAARLDAAAALYRGPFLDGVHVSGLDEFERWVEDQRQRLDHCFGMVLRRLACDATGQGRWEAAVEWSRRLTWRDPLSSVDALRLMRALIAAGDPTGALEHSRRYTGRVSAELGTPPAEELVRLAGEVRRRLSGPAEFQTPGAPWSPVDEPVSTLGSRRPTGSRKFFPRRSRQLPHPG
jgi:DNA-binding SARP family transcriptional activator